MDRLSDAKAWCEEARKLLKIKGTIRDTDSVDSEELYKARKSVETALEDLKTKKSPNLVSFENEYIKLAKQAQEAAVGQNMELARTVTAQLQFLHAKMTGGSQTEAQANQLEKIKAQYNQSLSLAIGRRELLDEKASGEHKFIGTVNTTITNVQSQVLSNAGPNAPIDQQVTTYVDAIKELGGVEKEYREQISRHSQFGIYKQKLADTLLLVKMTTLASPPGQKEKLEKANGALLVANKRASAPTFDYGKAVEALEVVNNVCKEVSKGKDFDSKKFEGMKETQKKLIKAKAEFDNAYKTANEKYVQSASLFGVVTEVGSVVTLRNEAGEILKTARSKVELAMSNFRTNPQQHDKSYKDISAAKDEVTKVSDSKIPNAIKESNNAKEIAKKLGSFQVFEWQELLRRAQNALLEMSYMKNDVNELLSQLEKLIEESSALVQDDDKRRDYPAATKKISGYAQILLDARNKQGSTSTTLKSYPDFQKVAGEIRQLLDIEARLVPSYVRMDYYNEITRYEENLSIDPVMALEQVGKLKARLGNEIETLRQEYVAADNARKNFNNLVTEYQNVAPQTKSTALQYGVIAQTKFDECSWPDAKRMFETAISSFNELSSKKNELEKQHLEWKAREEKLTRMMKEAYLYYTWVPLLSSAAAIVDSIQETRQDFGSTSDYAAHLTAFNRIEAEHKKFQQLVAAQNLPKNAKMLVEFFKLYRQTRDQLDKAVDAARQTSYLALSLFEGQLTELSDPQNNPFRQIYSKLLEVWEKQGVLKGLPPEMQGETATFDPNKLKQAAEKSFSTLRMLHDQIISKFQELNDKLKLVNVEDFKRKELERQKKEIENSPELQVRASIAVLLRLGIDVTAYEDRLNKAKTADDNNAIIKLAQELKLAQQKAIEQATERKLLCISKREKSKQALEEARQKLEGKLKTTSKGNLWATEYKEFRESLLTQFKDVESLLKSDDPDLVDLATQQLSELSDNISKIEKGAKPSFTDVHNKHKSISKKLGLGDQLIMKYMKDTHARLNDELNAAFVIAMKSSPEQGLKVLEPVEKEIDIAYQKAVVREKERKRYDERKKEVEGQWERIRKLTGTYWVGTRMTSFAKYFEGRIGAAESQRKEENNGIENAVKILNALKSELDTIEKQDGKSPRDKLIAKDSELAEDERRVKEMVRQFKQEVEVFKNTRIPMVTTAFAEKAKSKTTENEKKFEIKEGEKITKGMKKRISEAKKLVDKLSEDTETAKQQLTAGRGILTEQENLVQRLVAQPQSTNVTISKNLPAVQQNWKDKVSLYVKAVENLANKVQSLDEKIVSKDSSKKAADFIRTLKNQFPLQAFDTPFAKLKTSTKPEERRAAREEALRVMRIQRERLMNSEVLKKLAYNPVDRDSMMEALGYLRQSIKSIEIEVLVGV